MTLQFRLHLAAIYVWGFLSNGIPIYYRDSIGTRIALARWKYDPWTDTKALVTNHQGSKLVLHPDGKVGDYSSTKWMYVNKSRRTMQKLQHDN